MKNYLSNSKLRVLQIELIQKFNLCFTKYLLDLLINYVKKKLLCVLSSN